MIFLPHLNLPLPAYITPPAFSLPLLSFCLFPLLISRLSSYTPNTNPSFSLSASSLLFSSASPLFSSASPLFSSLLPISRVFPYLPHLACLTLPHFRLSPHARFNPPFCSTCVCLPSSQLPHFLCHYDSSFYFVLLSFCRSLSLFAISFAHLPMPTYLPLPVYTTHCLSLPACYYLPTTPCLTLPICLSLHTTPYLPLPTYHSLSATPYLPLPTYHSLFASPNLPLPVCLSLFASPCLSLCLPSTPFLSRFHLPPSVSLTLSHHSPPASHPAASHPAASPYLPHTPLPYPTCLTPRCLTLPSSHPTTSLTLPHPAHLTPTLPHSPCPPHTLLPHSPCLPHTHTASHLRLTPRLPHTASHPAASPFMCTNAQHEADSEI
ncbi:hypothetical protein Pcinc_028074 [Petrolisthes cinctipes]|uniref:Uncharacterized protein n=1 Tax=Petrolisthes cinctipes TaxID=88211 RepID=A0AAE1F3N0_PETCI|nr:hypothetical protein Pcinc_028074 [Petrolisthes cinctipes]